MTIRNFEYVFLWEGVPTMNTEEKRKLLHEAIDKFDEVQIARIYQLIRGILGKVL